ncbi:MAG: response regulator, partial [Pseudomonadota bacterium]
MFRRDYELYLTTRGDEALKIISERPIDVLVADQRMPLMSGVEVLTAAKKCSPGTVRILLTGYSDLDAIEGAMNDGEVFRFLNKPCAATELRGTIDEAARIARDTAEQVQRQGGSDSHVSDADVEALSSAAAAPLLEIAAKARPASKPKPTLKASLAERALKRRSAPAKPATKPDRGAAQPAESTSSSHSAGPAA